jgi:hypothetical protein
LAFLKIHVTHDNINLQVLPVFAVLAILTAAVPILLAPGEKALEEQRAMELEKNNFEDRNRKNRDVI